MAANTAPIWSLTGGVSNNNGTGMNALVTAAAADYTGISANNSLIFTAGVNGAFIQKIRFKAGGTNVVAVARVYINNGSIPTTATNNVFYGEVTLPATAIATNVATAEIDYPMNIVIPASFRIYFGLGAAVAAGWVATVVAGNY
jgi:hypothetical protein